MAGMCVNVAKLQQERASSKFMTMFWVTVSNQHLNNTAAVTVSTSLLSASLHAGQQLHVHGMIDADEAHEPVTVCETLALKQLITQRSSSELRYTCHMLLTQLKGSCRPSQSLMRHVSSDPSMGWALAGTAGPFSYWSTNLHAFTHPNNPQTRLKATRLSLPHNCLTCTDVVVMHVHCMVCANQYLKHEIPNCAVN
jgi:hypothetical protein